MSFSGYTAWSHRIAKPLRAYLEADTASAAVLIAATIAALVWANVSDATYGTFWGTRLVVRVAGAGVSQDLRAWVNTGLMTFFFLSVGLETRREFDLGELRDRKRFALPVLAGIGGMTLPVLIYLLFNAGRPTAHGWGAAMGTDTAFALGLLALVGPRFLARLRTFLLAVLVVDDLVSLLIIATVYTHRVVLHALVAAVALVALMLIVRAAGVRRGSVYTLIGLAIWFALLKSGVDPIVTGLAMGLLTYAYVPGRDELERATDLFRRFREQPTSRLAQTARSGLAYALSPNERVHGLVQPWTTYVIVPLFALANIGVPISGAFLSRALTSPVTLGILIGYVVGKPIGITATSWLVTKISHGRLRPPVGWGAVLGGASIAGIGFTESLLIATLAFSGLDLADAKVAVVAGFVVATSLSWVDFRVIARLPRKLRLRLLLSSAEPIIDLAVPVDVERDHLRGPIDAPVTMVEYGDLECEYCGRAEGVVRKLLADFGDLRYVWRHLPLNDVHPHAQIAAEATEAAADQGAFWEMHDFLLEHQGALTKRDLIGYAAQLHLDTERFAEELRQHTHRDRIAEDVESAELSGVSGTPTFFVNGRRLYGAYDIATLSDAVRVARLRAARFPGERQNR
ncbi:MAG: putative sodium/proton antiporter [Acidimicrobiaceae bacterium]|nr:putative sodium/proton antiporter [Acidimicrobiaceae bacterium]